MFPFAPGEFAPKKAWYVAAWSNEVGREPIERWIMDEPVALYRKENGDPVALDGRCPHHLFPLGKSPTKGDNIRCGYHGLEFAPDGKCVSAPFLPKVPAACRIKSYAIVERWNWLWIWPGDAETADESLIPDHFAAGLTDPALTAVTGFHMEVAGRYQLLNDNLLDLQHVEVLHANHIGGDGLGQEPVETTSGEDWVETNRVLRDITLPPVMAGWFGPGQADRVIGIRFHVPSIHVGHDIFTGAATSDRPGEHLGRINVYHAVTPARARSCHYFTAMGRDFKQDDPSFDDMMREKLIGVLQEDRFAAEEIERLLAGSGGEPAEMLFRSDKTLVTGRRLMQQMMSREREPQAPVAVPVAA